MSQWWFLLNNKAASSVTFFPVRSLHNERYPGWMAKYLPFLTPSTTMEHKHLPCIQRSWKVRRSQCICVMRGLERRIFLTLRNDYGNNMIIFLLSLSSFFPHCKSSLLAKWERIFLSVWGASCGRMNGPSLHHSPIAIQLHLVLPLWWRIKR